MIFGCEKGMATFGEMKEWTGEMVNQVKSPVAEPDDLRSTPRIYMMRGKY